MYLRAIIHNVLVIFFAFSIIYNKNSYGDDDNEKRNDSVACSFFKCKRNERCVIRKFWCKRPPCPRMIYCAKTQEDSLKGPSSCDNVKCSNGYVCIVKVRHCSWDKPCKEEVARCITEMDYYEGPASCAGFKCPPGLNCILRESFCTDPPCKLFRTCANRTDVHTWMDECKSLGCISPHECFLRRPEAVCEFFHCRHKPDCTAKSETELIKNEKCRGWICPKGQTCLTQSKRPCKNAECRINRFCQGDIIKNATIDNKRLQVEDSNKLLHQFKINSVHGIKFNASNMNLNPIVTTNINSPIENAKSDNRVDLKNISSSLSSLDSWLEYLKNQTGINAVNIWIKKSEDKKNHPEFRKWLTLVKDLLGNKMFDLWLEEIRNITIKNPIFQNWLPTSADAFDEEISVFTPWNATKEDGNHGIYETESLMNPEYKLQSFGYSYNNSNLFMQKAPPIQINERINDDSLGYSEQYYLTVLRLIQKLLESITPLIEFNKEILLKQLQNETLLLNEDRRISLLKILDKLKEEREIYAYVINKTQELISNAQPLVPSFYIDDVIEKFQSNEERNFSDTRKNEKPLDHNATNVMSIMSRSKDQSSEDDVDYVVLDYGEPITGWKVNQSAPKIIIRVENNFQPPPKIGEIKVENGDNILNRFLLVNTTSPSIESTQDDYYNDDEGSEFLKVTEDKTNSSSMIVDRSKDRRV
ncbi:uncharacterized protein [Chelonus insularis]|uniref:uncharacterized protein n=1 Tax=Chelonus insularis TaxID=460826 RepID=UPI00158BD056|nr:uncharacterized protein LOC118072885 [Chelonus insularis]